MILNIVLLQVVGVQGLPWESSENPGNFIMNAHDSSEASTKQKRQLQVPVSVLEHRGTTPPASILPAQIYLNKPQEQSGPKTKTKK